MSQIDSRRTEHSSVHDCPFELRHPEHFRRCGYCGSVHPGDLLVARVNGLIRHVDRSVDDGSGKAYVRIADEHDPSRVHFAKFYPEHIAEPFLTDDERRLLQGFRSR